MRCYGQNKYKAFKCLWNVTTLHIKSLASPAMGHWGTCSPLSSNSLIFQFTLELHKVRQRLYAVASPNIFVQCIMSCASNATNNFHVLCRTRSRSWRRHWATWLERLRTQNSGRLLPRLRSLFAPSITVLVIRIMYLLIYYWLIFITH